MTKLKRLDNGVRLVTERIEGVRSCGVGLYLTLGSRCEQSAEAGLSHFAEHMLFKGTPGYNALALNERLNELGGNFNAFTGQETLCLHGRTVDRKAPAALDLLLEMLLESTFPGGEIERERNVILEEYTFYEDTPDDLVVDLFFRNLWPSHPLGKPVIGTWRSIERFSRNRLEKYWSREFTPARLVVSLAGNFDAAECSRVLNRRLKGFGAAKTARAAKTKAGGAAPRQCYRGRQVEQVQFCFGAEAPRRTHPDRYAFSLLNMVLGGGMSSRLFQEIREKRGMAYSIHSFVQAYSDLGSWAISGGASPDNMDEVAALSLEQMRRLCEEKVDERELTLAREQMTDGMLLSLENTATRMMRNAEAIIALGRPVDPGEIVEKLEAVTPADVRRAARKYLRPARLAVSLVGPEGGAIPSALRRYRA